jgi:hypothetical protein
MNCYFPRKGVLVDVSFSCIQRARGLAFCLPKDEIFTEMSFVLVYKLCYHLAYLKLLGIALNPTPG